MVILGIQLQADLFEGPEVLHERRRFFLDQEKHPVEGVLYDPRNVQG